MLFFESPSRIKDPSATLLLHGSLPLTVDGFWKAFDMRTAAMEEGRVIELRSTWISSSVSFA